MESNPILQQLKLCESQAMEQYTSLVMHVQNWLNWIGICSWTGSIIKFYCSSLSYGSWTYMYKKLTEEYYSWTTICYWLAHVLVTRQPFVYPIQYVQQPPPFQESMMAPRQISHVLFCLLEPSLKWLLHWVWWLWAFFELAQPVIIILWLKPWSAMEMVRRSVFQSVLICSIRNVQMHLK